MATSDMEYFRKRAEAETAQAKGAPSPEIAQIHSDLAKAYLEKAQLKDTAPLLVVLDR